jgi:two-component system, response regulator FlrC
MSEAESAPNPTGSERMAVEPVAMAEASRRTLELAQRVAASDCTVLLIGESGTGKEVLARFIHRQSARAARAFVAVNCAALPESMLEAILFGYERGAFTGAHATHAGKFEQAQRGTLLLDEITEMPLPLQAKLLRVLQEREVERLGGRESLALDVRVIATTNRRLREEVAAGRLREDLYYRLNVFPLTLQPLRARPADILPLAMQLLNSRCRPGDPVPALSAEAAQLLLTYPWPGNVRELDNLLQRALILLTGPVIRPAHIQFEAPGEAEPACAAAAPSLAGSLGEREREVILEALRNGRSRAAAAETLGISARTLRYKLARLREAGVEVPNSRTDPVSP